MKKPFLIPKCFIAAALLLLAALSARAQGPAKTTVTDTLYQQNGQTVNGTMVIINPSAMLSGDGFVIAANSVTNVTVTNGVFSVALVPNIGASPYGSIYTVRYQVTGGFYTETWVVPATPSTVNLYAVRVLWPQAPQIMFPITQITPPPGCMIGQVPQWTALGWVCGSGGAALQTGGVNNTSQATLNFQTGSAVNGLSIAPTNPSGGIEQFALSGTLNDAGLTSAYSGVGSCGANQFVNAESRNAGPGCGQPFTAQTNGVTNASVTGVNFVTSTVNSDGLTATPSNPGTFQEKIEISGTALPVGGGTGLSNPPAHSVLVSEGPSNFTVVTSPSTNGFCLLGFNVTASAAVDPTCGLAGVPVNALSGNYSLLYSDRASFLKESGTSTSTLTLPQVTGTTAANFAFVTQNLNSGNETLAANAADKIDNSATGGSATLLPNFAAFVYQDSSSAPGNWWTVKLPTFAAFGSTCGDATHALNWSTSAGFGCQSILSTKIIVQLPVAVCQGSGVSLGGSGAAATLPGTACTPGSSTKPQIGSQVYNFATLGTLYVDYAVVLPSSFTSIDALTFKVQNDTATTGTDYMNFQYACVPDGSSVAPTYSSVQQASGSVPGTTGQVVSLTLASPTISGCAAGNLLYVRIGAGTGAGAFASGNLDLTEAKMELH